MCRSKRHLKNEKSHPKGWLHSEQTRVRLTLTGFEPALCFVNYVYAAFATHNAAITVPVLKRAERIANFHVLILPSVAPAFVKRLRTSAGLRSTPAVGLVNVPSSRALNSMVGDTGIEPVTPSMSTKCSTAELITHLSVAIPMPQNEMGREKRRRLGCYKRSRGWDQGLLVIVLFALCLVQRGRPCPRLHMKFCILSAI
jgi:hypothetical protein